MPTYKHHVFVCHNTRPEGAPRPSCTSDGKSELHSQLQQLSKEAGLGGIVRINKSGCLDQCEHGPTVVVYPEAVWYGHVKPEDAAEIVNEGATVSSSAVLITSGASAARSARSRPLRYTAAISSCGWHNPI